MCVFDEDFHLGQIGSMAAYGLPSPIPPTGTRPRLLPTSASMWALRARYTVPFVGCRAAEATVPGKRLHTALQVLQVLCGELTAIAEALRYLLAD